MLSFLIHYLPVILIGCTHHLATRCEITENMLIIKMKNIWQESEDDTCRKIGWLLTLKLAFLWCCSYCQSLVAEGKNTPYWRSCRRHKLTLMEQRYNKEFNKLLKNKKFSSWQSPLFSLCWSLSWKSVVFSRRRTCFLRYLSNFLSPKPQAIGSQAKRGKLNYRPNKSHWRRFSSSNWIKPLSNYDRIQADNIFYN